MLCPYCKETIQDDAIKCMHCGEILRKDEYQQVKNERTRTLSDYAQFPPYYQDVFATFDRDGGGFKAKWNWPAFFFGFIWYCVRGMWLKGLLMLAVIIMFGGLPAPFFWIYTGVAGNWDYYLLKLKGKQFW
jgi:Protein of unknown function (DUF2628)